MSLLRINAESGTPVSADGQDLDAVLRPRLAALDPGAPVLLMIHGYKYAPGDPLRCPHRSILALDPVTQRLSRCRSWPRAMGFGETAAKDGLCIAFGWVATGTIWRASSSAAQAGSAVAELLTRITTMAEQPVNILAHSLGARVALSALNCLSGGAVGRIVLLHGAEFRSRARAALDSPAGATAEVVNITTRENDLFDGLFRAVLAPHRPLDPALSAGLGMRRANWLDLRIDDPACRAGLSGMGFEIPPPDRRICHWSAYMRPGMFDLHRALLLAPRQTPLPRLADILPDGARRGAIETMIARLRHAPLPRASRVPS